MKPAPAFKTKIIRIEAERLRIHPFAQREITKAKLKAMRAELDLDAIGVLHAVEYEINGETAYWIIDGQHRQKALVEEGLGEWQVEVKVHLDVKDDARASELFLKLNQRASVHPFDKFLNAVKAGRPAAVAITNIAATHQLRVERTSRDGLICCVTILEKIFNFDDGDALNATLQTIIAAWGRTAAAVEGTVIGGLGLIFKTYNGSIDRPALVKKLAKYPGGASGLIGDARGLRKVKHASISRCIADQIIDIYNVGRSSNRLDPL